MQSFLKKVFGSSSDRELRAITPIKEKINQVEEGLQSLSDDDLRAKTRDWKEELSKVDDKDALAKRLEEILPEAFAVVKNACRRLCGTTFEVRGHEMVWEMVPYDVQLIGGYALHQGKIAEMATGEGKTLVGTLPIYLNALTGRGVHVVTVNEYLATRDSEWMGLVFKFLGLSVGCIQHAQPPAVRREQYGCDITYGTNSEFGFDYLRDNGMASRVQDQVQRGHYFAIIDEVDSILIDEARTPLIISGPAVVNTDNSIYETLKPKISSLVEAQRKLCGRWMLEAKNLLKKREASAENGSSKDKNSGASEVDREIGRLLLRIRNGNPKWSELLQLLEDVEVQKLVRDFELELHTDQTKKELYAEKEELFFAIDEKGHDADLTEKGRHFLSPDDADAFMLPDVVTQLHEIDEDPEITDPRTRMTRKDAVQQAYEKQAQRIHCTSQLLKAYCLFEKDVQYLVQDNKVVILDENTGRAMTGRRWSEGLHQAVEAKEGVRIEGETQTYATITIQNYFRLYSKLSGMTGTAETEATEFLDIYKMGVLAIPTHRPAQRDDIDDSVYKTRREKNHAILEEIQKIHSEGRPILVGTVSVEASEHLSRILKKANLQHAVLNAKYHEQEAEIVARAGQRGSITIATNMAGRGTDIKLGAGVEELGGLHVIGTERHQSRRIDRQLRGRCARQGDKGSSHFFVSLEDDMMRLFASDKMIKMMERLGMEEGTEIAHPWLNKSIEGAQKKVEQHHFQIRKRTLEYDDVMNKQREVIYGFRNEIMRSEDVHDRLLDIIEETVIEKTLDMIPEEGEPEDWEIRSFVDWVNLNFPIGVQQKELLDLAASATDEPDPDSAFGDLTAAQYAISAEVEKRVQEAYALKASLEQGDHLRSMERYTILSAIDKLWQEHLYNMDSLRSSISLRAYAQKDPLLEYKTESYDMFQKLRDAINVEICHNIFRSASSLEAFENFLKQLAQRAAPQSTENLEADLERRTTEARRSEVVSKANQAIAEARQKATTKKTAPAKKRPQPVRAGLKVGRNDPCPCGSGKKYKQCCGKQG